MGGIVNGFGGWVSVLIYCRFYFKIPFKTFLARIILRDHVKHILHTLSVHNKNNYIQLINMKLCIVVIALIQLQLQWLNSYTCFCQKQKICKEWTLHLQVCKCNKQMSMCWSFSLVWLQYWSCYLLSALLL